MVGLYASFCIAVTISIVGGRMGMISAATGAMASLMGPIIAKYGIEYLFAAPHYKSSAFCSSSYYCDDGGFNDPAS
ncbi:hypothetical protein D3C75_757490 [compost metagenome]